MGRVIGWAAHAPGGLEGLDRDLREGRSRMGPTGGVAADPSRPEWFASGLWRKASRLSRVAAVTVGRLLRAHPEVDATHIPLVWGSQFGESGQGAKLLDRWFAEGPERVSPATFQGSVHNATLGWMSLGFGLRGPQESVHAGASSGLAAVSRGLEWLRRAPGEESVVLVAAGDVISWSSSHALSRGELLSGDGVVAMLLADGAGSGQLSVSDGASSDARIARGTPLPEEAAFLHVDAQLRPERTLGHSCVSELLACLELGGVAVAQDDGVALTLRCLDPVRALR